MFGMLLPVFARHPADHIRRLALGWLEFDVGGADQLVASAVSSVCQFTRCFKTWSHDSSRCFALRLRD